MWTCLKWDELTAKTAHLASKREVTTETELVTTETLECRTSGQFNERTEYLIRKVVIPLDVPKQVRGNIKTTVLNFECYFGFYSILSF